MKSWTIEKSVKNALAGVFSVPDIEAGDSSSLEKSLCEIEFLQYFVPCVNQKAALSLTESIETRNIDPCKKLSESKVEVTKAESFQEDIKTSPLVLPATSSETDESDEMEGRTTSDCNTQTDPFSFREGKTLFWRNVNMTLIGKGDNPDRKLLDDVWGEVPKTQTTAIIGASGAGKTSLLNILSGRVKTNRRVKVNADVRLENYSVDPLNMKIRKSIAFVEQDDSLQTTATPRESIKFSAKLRLPRSTTDASIDQLVIRMINELGLSSCADTIVGGPLIKGISGGERKRTSIGVELVVVSIETVYHIQ